jgi:hypothetical protein
MFKTCQLKTTKQPKNTKKENLVDNPDFINISINKKS